MRRETSWRARSKALHGLLPLLGLVVAGCAEGHAGVEGSLASALEPIGASEVACGSSFGGDDNSGVCFEAAVETSLPDTADAFQSALVSAGLVDGGDSVECLKLTSLAPSVMGNCSVDLDGQLRAAGFDSAFISVAFTRDQLAALEGTDAYPPSYRVVFKVRRAGTVEPASAVPN